MIYELMLDQWTTDAGVLEDSIDGLGFGLSEIGGFRALQ